MYILITIEEYHSEIIKIKSLAIDVKCQHAGGKSTLEK